MKTVRFSTSDPRQLDLFAVAEEIFGTHFSLEPSSSETTAAAEPQRDKVYMLPGPVLELTSAEEDRFHKGGFLKLAASMLMGAIDDVTHSITPEMRAAALAYFTETEGPLPFQTVLEWLGPPLDDYSPQQWADRIAENSSSAAEGVHRYWRAVEQREADIVAMQEANHAQAQAGDACEVMYDIPEAYVHVPVERPRGM